MFEINTTYCIRYLFGVDASSSVILSSSLTSGNSESEKSLCFLILTTFENQW